MGANSEKNEGFCTMLMMLSLIITVLSCYWQTAPILSKFGWTSPIVDIIVLMFKEYFSRPMVMKGFTMILILCSCAFRMGQYVEFSWKRVLSIAFGGMALYFVMPVNGFLYTLTSLAGLALSIYGLSLVFRKYKGESEMTEDVGFEQNKRKIVNKFSINIPFRFYWKGRWHYGWINCINPFRASMVLGSPGSGKSFAIYNAFIEQMIRKCYTIFVYDYKFPDLSERVLSEIAYQSKHEGLWKKVKKKPHVYIINFDDPTKSNRCNPIHHSYITDPADTTEIADLVFLNINKGSGEKGFDFFNESAKVYLDALIWFLANYDPDAIYAEDGQTVIGSSKNYVNKGKYCTFPHVIELMAYNYKKTFQVLQFTKGLEAKISPFASALEGGAMEQLSGQIASAQIPMGKFVSPALYWTMTGDDFTLDINNPDDPKIVLMGNNPDRQSIYGTTLALYTSRMFKLINHKKKLPSAVLLDEVPTIFIKGLDNLIATARSNKVAIVLGAQDKSQLRRDYGEKESEVIMTTVGNVFSGSVEGRTAKDISETFGKEYKKKISESISRDSKSHSVSYQLEDILPASKIVDMTQGTFCGWVKDNFGEAIKRKKFYGEILVDAERNKKLEEYAQPIPVMTNIFGKTAPEMDEATKERLKLMHPMIANNEKELYKKFIAELVKTEVDKNFNKVKQDVKDIIDDEFKRTTPLAMKYKEEHEIED